MALYGDGQISDDSALREVEVVVVKLGLCNELVLEIFRAVFG